MQNRLLSVVVLGLILFLLATRQTMAEPPAAAYIPSETKVVVLPVVNKAAEFSKDFQAKIQQSAFHELQAAFSRRGFQVVDQKSVDTCLSESKLDLNDRENWRPANFVALGKKLEARLVVFCVVLDAHTKTNPNVIDPIGSGSKEGIADVRAYLVDARTGQAILDKKEVEGKNTGGGLAQLDSGMSRESKAVVQGMDKALKSFLSAYPLPPKTKTGN